jgi:hypothetical protein
MSTALRQLGVFHLDEAPWLLDDFARGNFELDVFDEYQGFSDSPFPPVFAELDRRFPNSKFILTIRDIDSWLRSVELLIKYAGGYPMEKWLYGINDRFDERIFRARYERHNTEVRQWFDGRRDDLLIIDLTAGAGWREICSFLDLPIPGVPFPHANKTGADNWQGICPGLDLPPAD